MPIYCITGTNRGLGLEFVRQLSLSPENTIIATARPAADLSDLKAVASATTHILACDTASDDSTLAFVREAVQILDGRKIDFLLNNAAINNTPAGETSLALDADHLAQQMSINVAGPARVVGSLHAAGALADAVRVLHMSSGLGSMELSLGMLPRKCVGYSISKAALNMLAVHQAGDLRARLPGSVVIVMDPGWVKTRMGGDGAVLEPAQSISGMLTVLYGLKDGDNGSFFTYNGAKKPW